MEVVSRLPKPAQPEALRRLVDAQRILCARCVSEEDGLQALQLLEQLAEPEAAGGHDYFPALLTLGSLHATGFEPAVQRDLQRAAGCYLGALSHERAATDLAPDLLSEAATELCNIVKEGKLTLIGEERRRLDRLAGGEGAGGVADVAAWARFACVEVDRTVKANSEDPEARERRLSREAARQAAKEGEQARQRDAARSALARAEELRRQGNDACRQGQLPGNASAGQDLLRASALYGDATAILSDCLQAGLSAVPEEAAELRRQRCVLLSNTAQVQVALADWPEVVRLASLALEDDPDHAKSSLRLARAHMEMCELEDAAQAVDVALSRLAARQGAADDAARLELSKVAEELSKALPGWRWTCSRPKLAEQRKGQEDFEKRIVGVWEYGQAVGQKNSFQIRLEPWGALVFQEESIKIDLMRKGLLRWRGELELVSGMVLNLSYEPGSDVMTTEFIPPPDVPEEQRWKGPSRFTATRSASAAPEAAPTAAAEEPPSSPRRPAADQVAPPEPLAPPPAAPELSEEERAALATQGVPTELWLAGRPELRGRYALVAGRIAGDRPIFRREPQAGSSTGELFLWSRGGNWGVTASLHASSLAAPFLARCPDPSGRARHPLELRRPRWQVRTGRGQEELDASMELTAKPPVAASSSTALAEAPGARAGGSSTLDEAAAGPPPPAVEIRGRVGEHSQVNGVYALSGSSWEGRPVYWQREQERQERPLALFWENGYWTVAAEACSLPRSLARCPAAAGSGAAAGPVSAVRGAWEFLCGERLLGAMVTSETRVYKADRSVELRAHGASEAVPSPCAPAAAKQAAAEAPARAMLDGLD